MTLLIAWIIYIIYTIVVASCIVLLFTSKRK